jgi:5-bromo-4-chloroindolyl phosphate hydrolysis protein
VILLVIHFKRKGKAKKELKQGRVGQKLSKEKKLHYERSGLSDEEIAFFRQEMSKLRQDISAWEEQVGAVAKLRAIDQRTGGLNAAKALFKEIVNEPKRMNSAGDFIHRHIPIMRNLTEKYKEISSQEVKNAEIYEILEKTAEMITSMSNKISEDYLEFVKNDLEDLSLHMELAKKDMESKEMESRLEDSELQVEDFSALITKEELLK